VRFRIEFIPKESEAEIVIRSHSLDENIKKYCEDIAAILDDKPAIVYYKEDQEFYFPSSEVLFFETNGETVYAHTINDIFKVNYRLYQLETVLPSEFLRISKSTIANTGKILSLSKNLSSSVAIQFFNTHKQVYASRMYFKDLKQKLSQRRI
jgi:DNA-binding LytR/AlgR family response regulator